MKPRDPAKKIKQASDLKKALARLPLATRKKVVFTNGVFDILHRGHVTYLNQARKLGAVLVVALNADASVKRLKGPTRPINTLADRAHTLAGLECVDFVTWFGEDTPLEVIRLLRPQTLVKGGDYPISQIVGAEDVLSWKGKVKSLSFVDGYSTTGTIKKLKD